MLKKLIKYGNSTALVIDKAILELLNVNEGTIVKLKTDGKSLIITPVEQYVVSDQKVRYDTLEALVAAKKSFEKSEKCKKSYEEYEKLDEKDRENLNKEMSDIFKKHSEVFMKFNAEIAPTKDFQQALVALNEKIDPATQTDAYYKGLSLLHFKFCPELAELNKDIELIGKKYENLV